MLALDLLERVAQRAEEVVVGRDDRAVHVELDHRLGLADGLDLALEIRVLQFLLGDVGGVLDDLEGLAVEVEDRIIRRLDPNLFTAFPNALEFVGHVLTAVELFPKRLVLGALSVGLLDKHAVMLALDLLKRVTQRAEEVVVGLDDRAVHVELDHRLDLADGLDLAREIRILKFLLCCEHSASFRRASLFHVCRCHLQFSPSVAGIRIPRLSSYYL